MATCPKCSKPTLGPAFRYCSLVCQAHSIAAARKPRKAVRIPKALELHEHLLVAHWLSLRDVLWCHVPNGEKRNITVAKKLKRMGVKPGIPDILIFTPPPNKPHGCGAALELKRHGVHSCSGAQAVWLADLRAVNWETKVCGGAEEAIAWLIDLGY